MPLPGKASAATRATKSKRQHSLPFKVLVGVLAGFASLFLLLVLVFVILYLAIPIPKGNAQAQQAVSTVYYADGKTQIGSFSETNRVPVKISQIPVGVQHDFIAAEDRSFYSNRGVSPSGIVRAFYNDITGKGDSQGGSTLTQQYVKNYFLNQDRSITRKVKELVISLKIDQNHSKSQILQDYLNSVYFGRGAYGIQAASQSYFHKDVSKLTKVEGAFLAAVVNNPDNMDPTVGPNSQARAQDRMSYVLNGMVTMHWMTTAERNAAVMPNFYPRQPRKYTSGPQGYIIQSVRAELINKLGMSESEVDRGGMKIVTTINKKNEDAAIDAVNKHIPAQLQGKLRAGLVAEEAKTGAVVAMYGGADYNPVTSPYSDADQALLQQASSMKAFTTIAALEHGKTMDTMYNGNNMLYMGRGATVSNDGGESWGDQPIYNMLANSINTAFVRLNSQIGGKATLDAAMSAGLPKTLPGMKDTNAINTLGTGDARVVDMATGYNTINNGGKLNQSYLINKITTFDNSYSYSASPKPKQAFSKAIADDVTFGLNKVGLYGTAAGTQAQLGRPMAGKTGTASGNKYIWFTGFTPGQITTSVGMYYTEDGKTEKSMQNLPGLSDTDIYGAGLPTQIWLSFMQAATAGQPVTQLPPRSYVNENKSSSASPSSTPPPSSQTYHVPSSQPTQLYPDGNGNVTHTPLTSGGADQQNNGGQYPQAPVTTHSPIPISPASPTASSTAGG